MAAIFVFELGPAVLLLVFGLVVLVLGGEALVRGASRLASLAGIPSLIIGLTVVSFGTSAPELAVSLNSLLAEKADIAMGNIVGSNIFNVLFTLGLSALVAPLVVSSQLVRLDVPLMIAVSFLVLVLGWDGNIGRVQGGLLFAGLLVYIGALIYLARREQAAVYQEFDKTYAPRAGKFATSLFLQLGLIAVGLLMLTIGARWLVSGASDLARMFGMSELLIGLTIVAVGTSLPEVATSVLASVRGERNIAVGNVVGSNIFNIMCVLGLSALVSPQGMDVSRSVLEVDIPVMITVAVACLPIFFTGNLIARWEGALFFGYYIAYTVYLVLAATDDAASRTFGFVMLTFVIPLTVITLTVTVVRALRRGERLNNG